MKDDNSFGKISLFVGDNTKREGSIIKLYEPEKNKCI
jgi:hypothetical protein